MCVTANMAIYAKEMTKIEVNGNLVTLQTENFQLFIEKDDFIMKDEVDQVSMNSNSFVVFHYYLEGDIDVAYYTMPNDLFNADIKILKSHFIFFEDKLFKPMKVKGDESCLYRVLASHIM